MSLKDLDYGRIVLLLLLPFMILPFQNCGRVFDKEDPQVVYANPSLGRGSTSRLPTSGSSSSSSSNGEVGSIGTSGSTNTGSGSVPGGSTVVTGGSNVPVATPVPTPAPTPPPLVPSTTTSTTLPNGKVLTRCNPMEWAVIWDAGKDIGWSNNYQFCMLIGRLPNDQEGYYWYRGIKDGYVDPNSLAPTLFASPEFATRYETPTMTNDQFALFMVRLTMYREPLPQEMAQLSALVQGMPQAQAQQMIFQAISTSPGFAQANPYLIQLREMYQ